MAINLEFQLNSLIGRQGSASSLVRFADVSDARAPRLNYAAPAERMMTRPMLVARWLIAAGLSVAVALGASDTAFARAAVGSDGSDIGAAADDGGSIADPVTQAPVVGGTVEPDYKYPWVVRTAGTLACHGVLIHPKWVLTAAHCVVTAATQVSFHRTDPYTGAVDEDERVPVGPGVLSGVFIHPMYNVPSAQDNDIALIKLAQPFSISPYIQTVGLPTSPRRAGVVGTVASFSHTMMLPPNKIAIFRAPIPQEDFAQGFIIVTSDASGSLCPGDSGSGFVTYENGRATVRGIASEVNVTSDCVTPSGNEVDFVDVFAYRDWILQTIGMTDYFLAGNTRLRWSGRASRGVMGIGCLNPYDTMWGPLNVRGVEEGANCEADQTQAIVCSLSAGQTGSPAMLSMQITGFTMKTTSANGATDVQSLPFSSSWASYYGPLPFGDYREFTCKVGPANVYDPGDGGVFAP